MRFECRDRSASESSGNQKRSSSGSGSGSSKKANKKKTRFIPLELQKLFSRLQLSDMRTVSTEVRNEALCARAVEQFFS